MRFLLLNQTFHPDVMATGQYLTEVALALIERGHEVTVVTSRRAYDNPGVRFCSEETWRGIRIYRVNSTGFGKGARWRRAADFASFSLACALRLVFLRRQDVVLALTSPPLISFLGAWLARVRGSRFLYWVMDFNPDEAIAAGWLRAGSLAAAILEGMSRFSLRQAAKVIALDRFMRERILAKGIEPEKVAVIPPWSQNSEVRFDPDGRQRFRKQHGMDGRFVVMYSGNHSPCHSLDTLIGAARKLADDREVMFCFVGGGSEFRKLQAIAAEERDRTASILCLPYQPLAELSASLSAADLHAVVMGEPFVGLVHPCKIYNILIVGAPVLYIGPRPSHITEILEQGDGDFAQASVQHGEVDRLVAEINRIRRQTNDVRRQVPPGIASLCSKDALLASMVRELEGVQACAPAISGRARLKPLPSHEA